MQVGAQKQPVSLIDCQEWSQSRNLGESGRVPRVTHRAE